MSWDMIASIMRLYYSGVVQICELTLWLLTCHIGVMDNENSTAFARRVHESGVRKTVLALQDA